MNRTFNYIHSVDERLILEKIEKHKLYLSKGIMVELIKEATERYPGKTQAVFLLDNDLVTGVGALIPGEGHYKGVLYVNDQVRGVGYGRALLGQLLTLGKDNLYFYPWSKESLVFYVGKVEEGILTLDNFEPYEKTIIRNYRRMVGRGLLQ